MKVMLVTPAWRRYQISDIVFCNFHWVKEIVKDKFELDVVVVGNDDNIALARKYNLKTITSDNKYLGRKFNDGYEFAFKWGADIAIPVGSDSLIHPDILIQGIRATKNNRIVFSTMHSIISEDGKRIGWIKTASRGQNYNKGALWLYRQDMASKVGYRPCAENINKSCDRSTIESIIKVNPNVKFVTNNIGYFQHVGLKNNAVQLWKYNDYKAQFIGERGEPTKYLRGRYPTSILKKINTYYKGSG